MFKWLFSKKEQLPERDEYSIIERDHNGRETGIRRNIKDYDHGTETYIDKTGNEQHLMTVDDPHVIIGKYQPLHPDCYASGENAQSRTAEQDAKIGKWAICGINRLGKIRSIRRKDVKPGEPVDPKPTYVGVGIDGTYWQSSQPKILKDADQAVLDILTLKNGFDRFIDGIQEKFEK